MNVAPVPLLTNVPTEDLMEAASTLTAVISASPIMSADAVDCGAAGVAAGVLARQHADRAEKPPDRGAEHRDDRAGGERSQHDDGDEDEHGSDPDFSAAFEPVPETPLEQGGYTGDGEGQPEGTTLAAAPSVGIV